MTEEKVDNGAFLVDRGIIKAALRYTAKDGRLSLENVWFSKMANMMCVYASDAYTLIKIEFESDGLWPEQPVGIHRSALKSILKLNTDRLLISKEDQEITISAEGMHLVTTSAEVSNPNFESIFSTASASALADTESSVSVCPTYLAKATRAVNTIYSDRNTPYTIVLTRSTKPFFITAKRGDVNTCIAVMPTRIP